MRRCPLFKHKRFLVLTLALLSDSNKTQGKIGNVNVDNRFYFRSGKSANWQNSIFNVLSNCKPINMGIHPKNEPLMIIYLEKLERVTGIEPAFLIFHNTFMDNNL
jgi:hypothetical protein